MTKYLLDTGILVHYVRGSAIAEFIDKQYRPSELPNYSVISIVSLGEMYSFAFRRNWGIQKQEALQKLLNPIPKVDINHSGIINRFAEMDAYCLGKHPEKPLPQGESSKSIGDNDLWIASTASVLKATLLTLDKDFLVFHNIFLDVVYVDQNQFK